MRSRISSLPAEWRADFQEYQRLLARRFVAVCAVMGLLVIPVFQVADFWAYASGVDDTSHHLGWRLIPLLTAIGILVLRWREPEGRWPRFMLILYSFSLMIMMTGMLAEHLVAPDRTTDFMARGLIVVVALVAVLATAGVRDLILVYGLPSLALLTVIARAPVSPLEAFRLLVHPVMMMVMGLVIAEVLYRVRLEAFRGRQELLRNASTDGLTGLANRRAFGDRLEVEHARCSRKAEPYALIMADLDHFKRVNDTWGHDVGDEVLVELAQRLQSVLRTEDELCRWGGEEFMVLLRGAGMSQAEKVADKLRRAVADNPFETTAGALPITTSLGIAVFDGEEKASTVARRADLALYTAKENGRNRYESA